MQNARAWQQGLKNVERNARKKYANDALASAAMRKERAYMWCGALSSGYASAFITALSAMRILSESSSE